MAELKQPLRGFKMNSKYNRNLPGAPPAEEPAPRVEGISFDGAIYWVRLAKAPGWPRTIRVTQGDIDGVKAGTSPESD